MPEYGIIMKNNTMRTLSPRETEIVARLAYEKSTILTTEQFDKLFNFPSLLRNKVVYRLIKKGILKTIKRGIYFYSSLEAGPGGSNINEFVIPSILFPKGNYYVGYSTMYNYYGFTNQIFQTMHILNTSLQREKTIGNMQFKMVKILANRMYGFEKIRIKDTEVIVSDKERTLIDLIYAPQPVGGLRKAFEIFKEQIKGKKIDIDKLISYTLKFPNIATIKRIGFALEQAGLNDKQLMPLLKSIKETSLVTLFPSKSRKGRINKKWVVIENAS